MDKVSIANVIDHCIPARVSEDFFDQDNLFPICTNCHSDVTKHFDNRNAHEYFKNYKDIKYSGSEFRIGLDGYEVDSELNKKLQAIKIIKIKDLG